VYGNALSRAAIPRATAADEDGMPHRRRYRKREPQRVVAVRLALDTPGFDYRKWGAVQHCKAGDWLVDNAGDVYTVDADTFASTYRAAGEGTYVKSAPVWAEPAANPGEIRTKEGTTAYRPGDYLVYNDEAGLDGYAVRRDDFERMYEPID
jgi:hypothetical protein